MTRRIRLRTQVLACVLSITLLALAAFDIAAVGALHRYLVGRTDSNLRSALTMTRPQLEIMVAEAMTPRSHPPAVLGDYDISFLPTGRTRPVVLEYGVNAGQALMPPSRLGHPRATSLAAIPAKVTTWPLQTVYRAETLAVPAGTLVASASLSDVNATVNRFRLIVIVGSAAVGLLIFGGVVLVMRRGLRPIETMASQADRITADQLNGGCLTHRVDHAGTRSEVGRLATALNGMLTRIETDVAEREASQVLMQRFFADASHELRTPLASLRANAELYQQGALRERPQVDEAMRRIALEAQRMSRLVDDMLRLARLDQHPAPRSELVDLAELIGACLQRARIADPCRTWRADLAGDLAAAGDEELLGRAIDNLLANVRTHTPEGSTATVAASVSDDEITIGVSDDGPGVPPAQLPRVFDRFYRAGAPAGRPGSGLGLAIVAEIAAVHGGRVAAALNSPRGLCVTMTLPVALRAKTPPSTAQSRASAVV